MTSSLARALSCLPLFLLAAGCVGTNGKPTSAGVVAGEVAANVAMAAVATAAQGVPSTGGGDHVKAPPPMTSCERQRREWWITHPEADPDHLPAGFKCTAEGDDGP